MFDKVNVLILVVVEDGLVRKLTKRNGFGLTVLILVVVEDGLVPSFTNLNS